MKCGQHLVAGQRGLHGHFGRKGITDFADDDDIRVLAHDMPQGILVGQVDFGIDGTLTDAVDDILDRILGGDDAGFHGVEVIDAAVHRGGFSGSRGAGDHDDPAGPVQGILAKLVHDPAGHPDLVDVEQLRFSVEQPQDNLFAFDRGVKGDPDVRRVAFMIKKDPAALMPPPLGDIGLAEDLDAAGERGRKGQGIVTVQNHHPVKAKAYPQPIGKRFDVNITHIGGLDGLDNDRVHDLHNGFGRLRQGMPGGMLGIEMLDGGFDGRFGGNRRNHRQVHGPDGRVDIALVQGIGKRYQDLARLHAHGDEEVLFIGLHRSAGEKCRIDFELIGFDEGESQLQGENPDQGALLDEIMGHQDFAEFAGMSFLGLQVEGQRQVTGTDDAHLHQKVTDPQMGGLLLEDLADFFIRNIGQLANDLQQGLFGLDFRLNAQGVFGLCFGEFPDFDEQADDPAVQCG
ncbi:hypothetical protein DESC_610098 [Desulfosarcina cetonica]|nr:hypothetical protein DESC_610098 [Desulfosarcina cetonica]